MLPVSKALDEIKFSIPREILEVIFVNRSHNWRDLPYSIDELILANVIRPRVLVDCDLVGGTEVFIRLEGIPCHRTDEVTTVYRIPKARTQGRSINSVLNVTFNDPTRVSAYGVAAGRQNTMMLQVGSAVMDAHGSMPLTSTARCSLIAENTVMIRDTMILPSNVFLRCILANDENLSHLQLRSYPAFAELCFLATKAYIYNQQVIRTDIGELIGGMTIGKFKEIVDTYSDANELYKTYLREKWAKIALMNDEESYNRFLRTLIGGTR